MVLDGSRANHARVIKTCKLDGRNSDGTRRLKSQNFKNHALRDGFQMSRKNVVNDVLQMSHNIWFRRLNQSSNKCLDTEH